MVLGPLMPLVGIHLIIERRVFLVFRTYLESMLDESGLVAATEMGRFVQDIFPEVSLAPEPFWISIFTSSTSIGADAKRSVSNNFFSSSSLNTNPSKPLLPLLQSLQIQFSASFNDWVQ